MARAIDRENIDQEVADQESEVQQEVLAGNRGQCSGYKRTSDFGHAREPFTWLSDDGQHADNQAIADELRALQRTRSVAPFEAWAVEDERWRMIYSGRVNVLYVELDARISRVRALLQWAPVAASDLPTTPQQRAAR